MWATDDVHVSPPPLQMKRLSHPKSWSRFLRNMIIESDPRKKKNHAPFESVLSDLPERKVSEAVQRL